MTHPILLAPKTHAHPLPKHRVNPDTPHNRYTANAAKKKQNKTNKKKKKDQKISDERQY